MKIFLLILVVSSVKAQLSFELQFLGDYLSQEEATDRKLCDTKYCLLDAQYLFYAATQNKSVRPCDDFKEFAVGTFDKYKAVGDRGQHVGFYSDYFQAFLQRLRRVLSSPVSVNDSRISKGLKTFFAKCVNSKYITKNGVNEAREFARSIGLKFYPETNDKDFNLKNHIDQQMTNSLRILFFRDIGYFNNPKDLYINFFRLNKNYELQLESYETMLYDMNQIYRNSSYSEEFTKEFREIANKQKEFYHRLINVSSIEDNDGSIVEMTIEDLNNLTSSLNLNWLTIINNQLITKVNSSQPVFVPSPQTISKIAKFLAESDKDVIADYLVYDFLSDLHTGILLYQDNKFRSARIGTKRPLERWDLCTKFLLVKATPALHALFLQQNFDKKAEDSLRKFVNETIEFAIKRFTKTQSLWGEELFADISERLQSIKPVFGYSDELVGPELLQELYENFDFDQNFIKVLHALNNLYRKLKREHRTRQLLKLRKAGEHQFTYRPSKNLLFIDCNYLNYPFYHTERPRYFNTATVSNLLFVSLLNELKYKYVYDKYNLKNFTAFDNTLQIGYEFYESWLESGGEELNLGANRLTNRQLYWVAVARVEYRKYQIGYKISEQSALVLEFHKHISKNPGFLKAFDCNITKQ